MFNTLRSRISRVSPAWVIFAALLLTYGYFYNAPGWNGNSRMDLVRAIVEDHTTRIDRFHLNTGDKALFEGHYYSDKAPGVSFLAVPAYAVYFGWLNVRLGEEEAQWQADKSPLICLFISTLSAIALPSAIAVAFFFVVATAFEAARPKVLFATAVFGLGSLAFPYSTVLFSHQLTGALLFISFGLLIIEHRRARSLRLPWRRWPLILSGLAAGYAVITEFTAMGPLLMIGLYIVWVAPSRRAAIPFVGGALLPATLLIAYNWASFGGPFALGYSHLAQPQFVAEMGQGFFGITYPKPRVVFELLLGSHRGLLPLSPVLALSVFGLRRMWVDKILRPELVLCTAIVAYFLLLTASYNEWAGGDAVGPRYLVPTMPFLSLLVLFGLLDRLLVPSVLLIISIGNMLTAAIFRPIVPGPKGIDNPLTDYLYQQLLNGRFEWNWITTPFGIRSVWGVTVLSIVWLVTANLLVAWGLRYRRDFGPRTDQSKA